MATYRERSYDDFLIEIGDRVEFMTPHGKAMCGTVTGRGAAGNYLEMKGDDGHGYSGYSSDPDLRKLFPGDDGYKKRRGY